MSYNDNLIEKIATANSFELVALLYQALIDEVEELKIAIRDENKSDMDARTDKVRDILAHLIATLGEENTEFKEKSIELYLYINETVGECYIDKKTEKLDDVIKVFVKLRDAWTAASGNVFEKKNNPNISNAVTYGKKDVNISGSMNDFGKI